LKENLLKLKQICFEIDSNIILQDINLEIDEGNFVSIIGRSGSGKTSLLKIISGLKKQTKGTVTLNNTILSDDDTFIEPESRNLGLVVQEKVLFPHLNVQSNVEFGIPEEENKREKTVEMLNKFHISNLMEKYPHEISGGEAQRVALARTLVTKPQVLLLDEPFSGLDQSLKDGIYPDIKKILKDNNMTTIMVSHDLDEVNSLSNKIYELKDGTLKIYES
tara:strand:- start:1808 stop:2467 length:660 start_codon:yes stop_codon:yes gene_type:complete